MPKIPSGMRKTAKGGYEYRFTMNGRRYSVYGKTVHECLEKAQKRRREIEDGAYRPGRDLTLDEYFARWEASRFGTLRDSIIRTDRYIYRLAADTAVNSAGLNTGCRFGEAGALCAKDVNDGMIRIRRTLTKSLDGRLIIGSEAKTGHSVRVIPAREAALAAIKEQQRQNAHCFGGLEDPESPIFRAPRGGLLGARCVGKDIDRICAAAGIERFIAHAFRDTFATRAVESGMQAKTLQEILGHADIGITMNLYAHVMEDTKRRQMTAVEIMRCGPAEAKTC